MAGDGDDNEDGSSREALVKKNRYYKNCPGCEVDRAEELNQGSPVFSLWAVSPLELGGLNFTTDDVGNVLSISGFALLVYQIFLYPTMEKHCGTINLARIAAALTIPLLQSYPFIAMPSAFTLHLVITISSVLMLCTPEGGIWRETNMGGDNEDESSRREPLVKKKRYYEKCPGCKVDTANELNQASPFKVSRMIRKLSIQW